MKSIGGYFALEIQKGNEYYKNTVSLNTGRNALEYIIKANNVRKIYIPYFTCDVILQPLKNNNILYEFYHINVKLEPIFDFSLLKEKDYLLYTNYFGIKDIFITTELSAIKNIIIDNSQAFFSIPSDLCFYSARKFFGVADGAYLFSKNRIAENIEQDTSAYRMDHLILRNDFSAEIGFETFLKNDKSLDNQKIKLMSNTTKLLLGNIDYKTIIEKRIKNFQFIESKLKNKNKFDIKLNDSSVPMVYPLWIEDGGFLREKLIANKIYTAKYWTNVLEWCKADSLESNFTNNIVHLPIDQRYTLNDMKIILNYV